MNLNKFYTVNFELIRYKLFNIFVLFILLYPRLSEAQILRIGPKAGILASKTIFDNPESEAIYNSIPSLSYSFGGVLNAKVSNIFSLQTELLYQQSRKHVENIEAGDWQKENYQFVNLPILLRASRTFGRNEFFVNAGPHVSYWLSGQGEVVHSEVFEFEVDKLDYEMIFNGQTSERVYQVNEPNRFQLGVDLGVGAVFPMGPNFMMVDLRYSFGHTNMVKNNSNYLPLSFFGEDLEHTQQIVGISVAYLFNLDLYTMSTKGKSTGNKKGD